MGLEGQGATAARVTHSRLDDRGYIMVVLLIGMAVTAVWMAATLPAWRQQAQREKEQELIFRGTQYARALLLYQEKNRALPMDIDTLVAGKYLRKKYKDPITNDDFATIGGVTAPGQGGTPRGVGNGSGSGSASGAGRGSAPISTQIGSGSRGVANQGPAGGAAAPGRGVSGPGGFGGQQLTGGITGVYSKSTATSIMIYHGAQEYDLWQFTIASVQALMRGAPGVGAPGLQNGRGTQGRGGRQGPGGISGPGGRQGTGPGGPGRGLIGPAPVGPGRGGRGGGL